MRYALLADRVFTPEGIVTDTVVVIANGKIEAVTAAIPTDCDVIRLEGQSLLPGFIDIHIHGRQGADVMDATDEALQNIAKHDDGYGKSQSDEMTANTTNKESKLRSLNAGKSAGSAAPSFMPKKSKKNNKKTPAEMRDKGNQNILNGKDDRKLRRRTRKTSGKTFGKTGIPQYSNRQKNDE